MLKNPPVGCDQLKQKSMREKVKESLIPFYYIGATCDDLRSLYLELVLDRLAWNKRKAASHMRMSERTIRYWIHKYNLEKTDKRQTQGEKK